MSIKLSFLASTRIWNHVHSLNDNSGEGSESENWISTDCTTRNVYSVAVEDESSRSSYMKLSEN